MQGMITLDLGNTNPHAGIFVKSSSQWNLLEVIPMENLQESLSLHHLDAGNTHFVVADVRKDQTIISKLQEQGFLLTFVKDYWKGNRFFGMPVEYTTSLGEDRLMSAFYTFKKMAPPLLLIDSGTYVTVDVIDQKGFLGGYIFPGPNQYKNAFANGQLLHEVQFDCSLKSSLPQSTPEAMGKSYYAFSLLIENILKQSQINKIIITGGSAHLWTDYFNLNHPHYVIEESPHLIHWSLHFWMTTQVELL